MPMTRQGFLSWVGVGWLACSLPVVIAACSSRTAHDKIVIKEQRVSVLVKES